MAKYSQVYPGEEPSQRKESRCTSEDEPTLQGLDVRLCTVKCLEQDLIFNRHYNTVYIIYY